MRIETLLCPVSLSAGSTAVLAYAASLAAAHGARLRLLQVAERSLLHGPQHEALANAERAAEASYQQAVSSGIRAVLSHEIIAVHGAVDEQIVLAAADPSVHLVLMGFSRSSGLLAVHWLDRVLRKTAKPVLAVPPGPAARLTLPWRSIVMATALDAGSSATHVFAAELAQSSGARLTAVHVIEDLPPAMVAPEVFPLPAYRDFALEEASRQLDAAFEGSSPRPAGLVVAGGELGAQVARLVKQESADLVIVGFRLGSRHFGGVVASRLLNRIDCPVLVVPHAAATGVPQAA